MKEEMKITFFGALTILFVALKLMEKIDWSWVWVFGPLWIPFAVVLFLCVLVAILGRN